MPKTLCPPPTDRSMWRRLLRVVHPDTGGDGDLFIWTQALQEHVAGDTVEEPPPRVRREPPQHPTTGDRVDFVAAYTNADSFQDLTGRAVAMADEVEEPYASVLRLLNDCYEALPADTILYRQQHQGATFKQCAAIAYRVGMSTAQRTRWYAICRSVPMAQRMAGHILGRLQQAA